jgi:hypothetical protein
MACGTERGPAIGNLAPGYYIGFEDAYLASHSIHAWYWWDADQFSFNRLEAWATRFETRSDAEDEMEARDMANREPRAQVVRVR